MDYVRSDYAILPFHVGMEEVPSFNKKDTFNKAKHDQTCLKNRRKRKKRK